MINNVVLIGRLTADPVLHKTQTGKSVVSFTVANSNDDTHTNFINCVAWEQKAEAISTYTVKGSLVGVFGWLQSRSFDDPSGKKVYVTEIVVIKIDFLSRRKDSEIGNDEVKQPETHEENSEYDNDGFDLGKLLDIDPDSLPF